MKTDCQEWQWERCFHSKGAIKGIIVRLRQIANYASTLPEESEELEIIVAILGNMLQMWDGKKVKERSWDKYERFKKGLANRRRN